MNGINDVLWFIHRSVFELSFALMADVFIYFYLKDHPAVQNVPVAQNFLKFLNSDGNFFFQAVAISCIVILTGTLIQVLTKHLSWIAVKAKENLFLYPPYFQLKEKIAAETRESIDPKYSINVREIESLMSYKIMQHHKEFNTFLWYKATKYYAPRDFGAAIILTSLIVTPFAVLGSEFVFSIYMLLIFTGAAAFCAFVPFLKCKMDQVNRKEAYEYTIKNRNGARDYPRRTSFDLGIVDAIMVLMFGILGTVLICLAQSSFGYNSAASIPGKVIAATLYVIGVDLLLSILCYFLFLSVFREHNAFKKTLLDAFISIRYGKELFRGN